MRIKKLSPPGLFSLQVESRELTATFHFTHVMRTISPMMVQLQHEEEHKATVRIAQPERFWAEVDSAGIPVRERMGLVA